jgi:hypothetical protein
MEDNVNDILTRAGKTWLQTFVGLLVASWASRTINIETLDPLQELSTLAGLAFASIPAAVSVLQNSLKLPQTDA